MAMQWLIPTGSMRLSMHYGGTACQKSLIIDHLVGAYCPMVAQESSLTEAEKTARLQHFTGQITQLVYGLESGLDIIIHVPLTPDVVTVLNATASK
jgi:hypothetical protein